MGRSRRKRRSSRTFVMLDHGLLDSPAWRSLSNEAFKLLVGIWRRHNGQNNGTIPFSHREARELLRVGNNKVVRARQELQEKGFIILRRRGAFSVKHKDLQANEWEITAEDCDDQPAKRLFRHWKPDTVPDAGTEAGRKKTEPGSHPGKGRFPGQEPRTSQNSSTAPDAGTDEPL